MKRGDEMELDAIAFGAHPDDVELSCAGTLIKLVKRGYAIGACDLTAGELGTRGTTEIRAREAERAAEIMGLKTRLNLGIPDGRIEQSAENRLKVIGVLRRHRPRAVFAPYWVCRHYDHVHASRLVSEACYYSGLVKIDTGRRSPPFRPRVVIYYKTRCEFEPTFLVDISEETEAKMAAIRAHKSQFYDPESSEPETPISSERFLERIEVLSRYYGLRIGAEHAEPFLLREALAVDDPIALFQGE